ncbi:hypothetical protein RRG08_048976 [Elysia crispata]|uniref:Uncharacterized protein n=1 Tax=Elysia crispata TaxID=231223 RepID=A0AAE1CWD0_9GAST|nr:hypothetical protein RRG08_048976 [Elysia crispata]
MPQHLTTRTKQLGVRKLANKDIDYTQYSVKSTFARIPQSRIVLCPWRVFSADPESVSDSFRELDAEDLITYADDINVMLNVEGMKTPEFGVLDDFSQTWIIQTDEINLDNIIEQIKSHLILLGMTLTNRKLLGDHEEIPVVAFLDHKTPEVREAVMKLETCRDELHNKPDSKFCVEVNIGETVNRWASEVLGQSMTSRKATYNDFTYVVTGDSVILGSLTEKTPDQRLALLTLMRRARTDPKFSRESPDSGVHLPPPEPSRVRAPALPPPVPAPVPLAPESFSKKVVTTYRLSARVMHTVVYVKALVNYVFLDIQCGLDHMEKQYHVTAQVGAEKPHMHRLTVLYPMRLPSQNDRTTVLQVNKKSKLKPTRKPSVNLIQVDYAKDQDKKQEEPKGIQRQDSYMQAEDLDTIARAFKMSKTAAEPRPSVVSPVTLSNFRADLLFGDVDSDDETERSRRGSVASNFLDPNYEEEMGKFFKSAPNQHRADAVPHHQEQAGGAEN